MKTPNDIYYLSFQKNFTVLKDRAEISLQTLITSRSSHLNFEPSVFAFLVPADQTQPIK